MSSAIREDFREVTPCPNLEGVWQVKMYATGEVERTYPSQVAAWRHACTQPFVETDTLPKISPGDFFHSTSGAYTKDPRFAVGIPASQVDAATRIRIDKTIVEFIRARLGLMDDMEVLTMSESEKPTTLDDVEDNLFTDPVDDPNGVQVEPGEGRKDAERLAVPEDAADVEWHPYPTDDPEPVTDEPEQPEDALSPKDRRAFDNFTDLAETAPTETAREFWQVKARAILGKG